MISTQVIAKSLKSLTKNENSLQLHAEWPNISTFRYRYLAINRTIKHEFGLPWICKVAQCISWQDHVKTISLFACKLLTFQVTDGRLRYSSFQMSYSTESIVYIFITSYLNMAKKLMYVHVIGWKLPTIIFHLGKVRDKFGWKLMYNNTKDGKIWKRHVYHYLQDVQTCQKQISSRREYIIMYIVSVDYCFSDSYFIQRSGHKVDWDGHHVEFSIFNSQFDPLSYIAQRLCSSTLPTHLCLYYVTHPSWI